jgi:hypothetical protein
MQKSFLFDTLLPKLEMLGWAVAILGFAAKWFQLAGGNVALIIGLSTLSLVYFLNTYAPARLNEPELSFGDYSIIAEQFAPVTTPSSFLTDSILPKVINMSSAVLLIGMLFKLMFWNGSRTMLIVGEGTLLMAVILLLLNQRTHVRAMLLAGLGGLLLYVSADELVRQFHRNDPVLVEKMIYHNHHPYERTANEAVRQHLWQQRNKGYN